MAWLENQGVVSFLLAFGKLNESLLRADRLLYQLFHAFGTCLLSSAVLKVLWGQVSRELSDGVLVPCSLLARAVST